MKTSYRGYEISVSRERAMGGWDNLYYSIFRESDQREMVSNFTTGSDSVSDYIRYMKERIDAEHAAADPWEEAAEELRDNWHAFTDADPFDGSDTFAERMEKAGYAELVSVTAEALSDPFAAERGIEPGGMMWQLTEEGRRAMARHDAFT